MSEAGQEIRYHSGPSASRQRTMEARRANLIDVMRDIEAMTDAELDLEIAATGKNFDIIGIELRAENEGVTNRGSTWKIAAEKRISDVRWRRKLCMGELARRTAAARAARGALPRDERGVGERQRAHIEMVEAARAAKAERLARHAEEDKTAHACFVRHAKAMLPPETVRALWDAVNAELDQPKETNP